MSSYVLKYKVLSPYIPHIDDVEAEYGDKKAPVRLISCLCAAKDQYLDESVANASDFAKSVAEGRIAEFMKLGHIVKVYLDKDTNEEVSEAVYNESNKANITKANEVANIASLLQGAGISFDQLAALLKQAATMNQATAATVSTPATPAVTEPVNIEMSVLAADTAILKQDLAGLYVSYSKLKYQDKLNFIKTTIDNALLGLIKTNEKSTAILKKVVERIAALDKLNVQTSN